MAGNKMIHLIFAVMAPIYLMYPLVSEGQEEYVFVRSWPSDGTALLQPNDVAVDTSGNVYVADYRNYRVQVFSSEGAFLRTLGEMGATGVAADNSGNIYVSHQFSIKKLTSKGKFLDEWYPQSAGSERFFVDIGVAADSSENVYIADCANECILKFTSEGEFLTSWGKEGSRKGEFLDPADIAVDSSGNIYVADAGNCRVQKFTSEGDFLTAWGAKGSADKQFLWPRGIAVSRSGDVYVVDTGNQCIKVYHPVGGMTIREAVNPDDKQLVTWGGVKQTELYQNYPNPFNPETWIPYQLGGDAYVVIKIYAATGHLVRTLNLGHKLPGFYADRTKAACWDGKNETGEKAVSDVYFYTIQAGDFSATKKMIMRK